jgi:hypothetical protein
MATRTAINIEERFPVWTRGCAPGPSFCLDRDYYLGRGPTPSDVNSKTLEGIYRGLREEVGPDAAKNFAQLVNNMTDLSAPLFIDSFMLFVRNGYRNVASKPQLAKDRDELGSIGPGAETQMFAVLARNMTGGAPKKRDVRMESVDLKADFIKAHAHELA